MGEYLERAKELRAITDPHYNCAQSVVVPFAKKAGMDEADAMRFTANFGMGMKRGATCGSIVGGLMVLGLFGIDDPQTVSDFHKRFRDKHDGMLDCAQLLKANSDKGLERKPHCDGMVYESVGYLEEILKEKGKI
ncbi:MAG: C-GCAxxG-C-C family protein [Lachnospiraceae bacterium]|nr:C-GCAxxG-C-C family protein [Lachnospiraceae bacterium]